jgi:DNA-3-methyladenine glycosylase I
MEQEGRMTTGLIEGADGVTRCFWAGDQEDYRRYHDNEWGRPVTDDRRLFEKICLEGFQSGLSWLTILRKRESFRRAFAGFDPEVVAAYTEDDVARLLADTGIVRHGGKIRAAINNARQALELREEAGSLAAWFWAKAEFGPPPVEIAPTSPASVSLAKDLKRRGWQFVGPTTVYAFMEAMGLVNDHLAGCWVRERAEEQRQEAHRRVIG